MQNYNWNYPTTMWVGENRIKDLGSACNKLNINKPLLVTDKGLAKSKIIEELFSILDEKKLGDLGWIEYRDLKKGSDAFKEIHNGTCVAPKIILIP